MRACGHAGMELQDGLEPAASALSQLDFGVPGVERSEPPDRNFPGAHFVRPRPPNPQFQL